MNIGSMFITLKNKKEIRLNSVRISIKMYKGQINLIY